MSDEGDFQNKLRKELEKRFDGCIVLKNDPNYIQGVPDLLVLYKDKWAALECKVDEKAHRQPNQHYYVKTMNDMSYAAFVYPDNMEEVLNEIQSAFKPNRTARVSRSK